MGLLVVGAGVGAVTACGASDEATTSEHDVTNWQDRVLTSQPVELPSPEATATLELANAVLDGHEDIWAKNHYRDGSVIVNVTPGWEAVVGDELEHLVATAPTPVEIREVDHSLEELMEPALDPSLNEADYAGASMVTATVDPERNALVVGLTEVDEDSVSAAAEAFGSDALFVREDPASPTVNR
ncbi:hypothetical protein [Jiangella endophytica]|uniref:hypothetical protein n=1 Tax=Jiangella endophytica TaxID=1623398 RepID=UPI0018E58803|nr:hypothetical protein [Jiangella endophytica]